MIVYVGKKLIPLWILIPLQVISSIATLWHGWQAEGSSQMIRRRQMMTLQIPAILLSHHLASITVLNPSPASIYAFFTTEKPICYVISGFSNLIWMENFILSATVRCEFLHRSFVANFLPVLSDFSRYSLRHFFSRKCCVIAWFLDRKNSPNHLFQAWFCHVTEETCKTQKTLQMFVGSIHVSKTQEVAPMDISIVNR
jgi:hypothetical protein